MKKYYLLIFILLPSLLFLGCSHESLSVKADGGIFKSDDGGKSFRPVNKIDEERSLSGVTILDIAVNPDNSNIVYVGTAGSGMFKTEDGGETWAQLFTGSTVLAIEIDPRNPNVVYISDTVSKRGKIFKTIDGNGNWEEIYTEPRFGIDITALAIDPQNSSRLYAGDSQGVVFRSVDGGERWRLIDSQSAPIIAIRVSQTDPGRIYYAAGSSVSTSGDGGETFERLNVRLLGRNSVINSLEIDPVNPNVVYVSSDESIIKSADAGKNFFAINILNPNGPTIDGIVINSRNPNEWFYGSGYAFYKTIDNGATWAVTQLETNRRVKLVEIDPSNPDVIYLGVEKAQRK